MVSPHSLSSSTTTTRHLDSADSPEFEFSILGGNPEPALLSADQLFSHGFLLPLHLLPLHRSEPEPEPGSNRWSEPAAVITSSASSNSILGASKRWMEIFKREKKPDEKPEKLEKKNNNNNNDKNKKKKKNSGNSSAELNINIWPFSRSQSAGNNSTRSRPAVLANRKTSSAPCSRSNSSGSRRSSWPSSPGRSGVHLGRSSPVWQVKKAGSSVNRTGNVGGDSGPGRVLKINVPVGCRSDESSGGSGKGGVHIGGGGSNGNLFGLRGLFSKKSGSVLTV